MKKIIVAIAMALIPMVASAQWDRINVGVDYAWQETPIQFGGDLFNRPDRNVHLNISYRLWQHWEVGVYIGVQGANCYNGGTDTYHTPQGEAYAITHLDKSNDFEWSNGVLVQYHILPFSNKEQYLDGVLRLGFTPGGAEIDNFWGGIGISCRITPQVSLLVNTDFGSFRLGRMANRLMDDDHLPVRCSAGIQVKL